MLSSFTPPHAAHSRPCALLTRVPSLCRTAQTRLGVTFVLLNQVEEHKRDAETKGSGAR
ncbi:hypothetical protein BJ972_001791 [Agromyces atrinae]|uniref:Uncharacterized protein n=1 Tax=Agromyces atrinae TaxID=592376 RepID=A0A852S4C0_9MICO|nr:hypothetical protein [Agromyces atrinae]